MVTRLTEVEHWDTIYDKTKLPREFNPKNYKDYLVEKIFIKYSNQGDKVLEIGAGASAYLPYFNKHLGCNVFGIDYSPKGCELADQNLRLLKANGRIFCMDLFDNITDISNDFDIVFSAGVIEHFEDPKIVICKMKEYLADGGLVIATIPNTGGLPFRLLKIINSELYRSHKIIKKGQLAKYFEGTQMKVIDYGYLGTFRPNIFNEEWLSVPRWLWWTASPTRFFFNNLSALIGKVLRWLSIEFPNPYFSPYQYIVSQKY